MVLIILKCTTHNIILQTILVKLIKSAAFLQIQRHGLINQKNNNRTLTIKIQFMLLTVTIVFSNGPIPIIYTQMEVRC